MRDYEFNAQTLGNLIKCKAEELADEKCIQFESGTWITYRDLDEITNRIANGLLRLGMKKGDKLALFLPNSLEMVFLWLACAKIGVVDVPVNLANKGLFLSHIINDSEARIIVSDYKLIDRLLPIQDELGKLENVVVWSGGSSEKLSSLRFASSLYEGLLDSSPERPETDVKSSDIQTIIYTSGTTGPSKGVMLPHAQQYLEAREYCEATRATSEDIFFTCLPLFHANARLMCVLPALLTNARVVIRERLSASRFWDQIRAAQATIFNSLGAMATFLYNQPRRENDRDHTARICMAAPMPKDIYQKFGERFGVKIIEGYGLTETGMITYNPYDHVKIGSCGKPTKSFRVVILDENDSLLPPKKIGEIAVQCTAPFGMSMGYYNLPEKTIEAFRNFYFHTGDAGSLDDDGFLYFSDRIKDYIRRRGENISSFEVERVFNAHPKVLESAAVGIRSNEGEEELKVFIVPKESAKMSPEELIAYCEPRMPYFAVPRFLEFVDVLPKTPNEKIQKAKLREAGCSGATWDREKSGYKVKI